MRATGGLLGSLLRLAVWLPVFYALWAFCVVVWSAMLVQGWLANDGVVLPDCFLRQISRRQRLRATIRPWAIRVVLRTVRATARIMPGVVGRMDAWRLLGLCSVMWALQSSPLLLGFHVAVLCSPLLTLAHVVAVSRGLARAHPWFRSAGNLATVWYCVLRYGITATEFAELRLHEPDRRRHVDAYASTLMWLFDVSLPVVHAATVEQIGDKQRFHEFCTRHGLRTPAVVARFRDGMRVDGGGPAPPVDLFSKENCSSQGSRGEIWRHEGDGYVAAGRGWSAQEMMNELASRTRAGRPGPSVGAPADRVEILLQERVVAHAALAELSSALPTCRIITIRPFRRPSRVTQAMFRMASAPDASVDNFHAGGIACGIDLATGTLRTDGLRADAVLDRVQQSPRSGQALDTVTLPYWSEAVQLCRRLHDEVRWPPEIGWDLALTPEGPSIIEANHTSVAVPVQAVNGAPYGVELYEECLASWLEPEAFTDRDATGTSAGPP